MTKTITKFICIIFMLAALHPERSLGQYDSVAIAILDSMSTQISGLESCSFKFSAEYDIPNKEFGLVTHTEYGSVFLKGPNKLFMDKKGDKGHKQFFYNGETFSAYSFDKNVYATKPETMDLIELIDSVSSYFGVEFPGTDVFYPDFVNNILETSNNLIYLGPTVIDDIQCYHIAGAADDITFQYWISCEGPLLPVKMRIVYIDQKDNPNYEMTYSDWKLNESIDDSKFLFTPPQGAELIKIIKR